MLKFMRKTTCGLILMVIIFTCFSDSTMGYNNPLSEKNLVQMVSVDTMSHSGESFLIVKMNRQQAFISMADSVIPDMNDRSIALCVEAAFTGELLEKFSSSNVGGDYVMDGRYRNGYKCRANSGLLFASKQEVIISDLSDYRSWVRRAVNEKATLFQQILIVKDGKNVYRDFPIKPSTPNIYRAACIAQDGEFMIIQSVERLPFADFINSLITMGVKDALYLDMGKGWNYGWYRISCDSEPVEFFDYRTPYQTNWLLIRKK